MIEHKTSIEKLRQDTFGAISHLSYNRSGEETEQFYDRLDFGMVPMKRNKEIQEFFGNPHLPYPDDPANPLFQQESVKARVFAMREIIALINELHRQSIIMAAPQNTQETYLERMARTLAQTRTDTVRSVADLTGLSVTRIQYLLDSLVQEPSATARKKLIDLEFREEPVSRIFRGLHMEKIDRDQIIFQRKPDPAGVPFEEQTLNDCRLPTARYQIIAFINNYIAECSRYHVALAEQKRKIKRLRTQLAQLEGGQAA